MWVTTSALADGRVQSGGNFGSVAPAPTAPGSSYGFNIDLAAEGILRRDELRSKLALLEETRETARRELKALEGRREKIEELECDRDALLESYAAMVPENLDALAPEERHRVYKMLRLRVYLRPAAPPEVSGVFGGLSGCETETACSRWSTARSSP